MKNRKLAITVLLIIILIVAAFVYVFFLPKAPIDNAEKTPPANNSTETKPVPIDPNMQTPAPMAGKYTDYSEASFAAAANEKRILFFHAAWCPQCRALEKSIQAEKIPSGIVILKVDYDTSQKLRRQYGVTLQTTLVEVDKNGTLKKKFVAYDEPSLAALIREFEH